MTTTTTEPTSVLPAKPATRAALVADAAGADVAPSPLDDVNVESTATLALGDADDLIARLADEQIDRLLAAEEGEPTPPPVAAPKIAEPLAASPPIATPMIERRVQPATDASPAAFPASFSPPGAKPAPTPGAAPADASSETPLAAVPLEPIAASTAPAEPIASVDAHAELRSDAAAVAAELADDLARSPSRVAAAPKPIATAASHDEASPSAINRAARAIGVVPTAIVDVINLPVRAANDAIREAIGAAAIVTLANAAALLLYLMLFR